jgi:hypothetical protein
MSQERALSLEGRESMAPSSQPRADDLVTDHAPHYVSGFNAIVVECAVEQAEAVATWLRSAMVDAMAPLLGTVPVVVDVQTAARWGE